MSFGCLGGVWMNFLRFLRKCAALGKFLVKLHRIGGRMPLTSMAVDLRQEIYNARKGKETAKEIIAMKSRFSRGGGQLIAVPK